MMIIINYYAKKEKKNLKGGFAPMWCSLSIEIRKGTNSYNINIIGGEWLLVSEKP